MNIINLSVDNIPCASWPIMLAQQGEYATTQVKLNYQPWIDEFGTGQIILYVKRPGEEMPYPVLLQTEDGTATWTISQADTAIRGQGEAQFVYLPETGAEKSAVFSTFIAASLCAPAGDPPSGYDDLLEQLTQLATETLENAENSEAWAVGERDGEPVTETDETYQNNSKFYADLAGQRANSAGYAFFDVNVETGQLLVRVTEDYPFSFIVNENQGTLEVIVNE